MSRTTIIETRLFPNPDVLTPLPSVANLVIHHTGGNAEGTVDPDPSAATIDGWHKNQGWAGIGYHYVIRKGGDIERGRPRQYKGSQAWGLNSASLGIHLGGDYQHFEPTEAQLASLAALLADLCEIYNLDPMTAIIGHRDVADLIGNPEAATDCPGDHLYDLIPQIRLNTAALLQSQAE